MKHSSMLKGYGRREEGGGTVGKYNNCFILNWDYNDRWVEEEFRLVLLLGEIVE